MKRRDLLRPVGKLPFIASSFRGMATILLVALQSTSGAAAQEASVHFEVKEGRNLNEFLRDGKSAAHLVLRSGQAPRIVVAFPAGDSGVGLWFQQQEHPVEWVIDSGPTTKTTLDSAGRPLYGITFEVSLASPLLVPRQAVLSSVRVLRDYEGSGAVPAGIAVPPRIFATAIEWSRDRLDGAAGYRLTLNVVDGRLLPDGQISAGANGRIKIRVTASSGETPLTPLSSTALFNGTQSLDPKAIDTLTFLSYREKFLAGSWHYNTYFGRDTLMSIQLLMPVLAAEATESGLRSVLARLSSSGEVAHEESIGEFAILSHREHDGGFSDAPSFDYSMVDGAYLLAPVTAAYLLDNADGKKRAYRYLRANIGSGAADAVTTGAALLRNLRFVARSAAKFAFDPRFENLISLKPGASAGQWRDSDDGLGGGRYPYDVNAVLVPAALEATARLVKSGLLDTFLTADDRQLLGHAAAKAADVWRRRAPSLFNMTVESSRARASVESYARTIGVPASQALGSLDGSAAVTFHAISLDAYGHPVPIINSDEGFELLFDSPAPDALEHDLKLVTRPFPLGLMTDAGMLVANPVFADAALQARFTNHAYHGTVVWSWQQALFAAGLERQLRRTDLAQSVKQDLLTAQQSLWQGIRASKVVSNSELWSWRFDQGQYHITPFGASDADNEESDAAQLWSSVYLAVMAPREPPEIGAYQADRSPGPSTTSLQRRNDAGVPPPIP